VCRNQPGQLMTGGEFPQNNVNLQDDGENVRLARVGCSSRALK
jgi:hypothetical protein